MVAAVIEEIHVRSLALGEFLARLVSSWMAVGGLVLMVAFALTLAAVGWAFPINNWDMFAYVAAAKEAAGLTDPAALHREAYEAIRQSIPAGDFIVLTQDRDYRVAMYNDAAGFLSMLGFYRVKWLYVESVAFLSSFVTPYQAIRLMSVVPAALCVLVAAWWLKRERALHLAPLALALFLGALAGDIAREGTPDAISAFLFIAGIFAFVAKKEALVAILLVLAFLARPDHIAYTGVLMVVALVMRTPSWGAAVAFFVSLAGYVVITKTGGHPGWWVHFWFTHVEFVKTIAGFDPDFSLAVYLKSQMRVVVRSLVEETWIAVLVVAGIGWWQMALRGGRIAPRETTVLVATLLAIGAKMVIFPLNETRFWFPYLIVFGLVVIGMMRDVRWLPERRVR